jgi:hypothetical protein
LLDVLVTGAAAGIIGCLSGQGVIALLAKNSNSSELSQRLDALEAKELVLKTDPVFISRDDVQQALTGTAQVMQTALTEQGQALVQMVQQSNENNAKAARVAEARQQVMQPEPAMSQAQMQQMYSQVEQLTRQING